jgi:hypothetical protein
MKRSALLAVMMILCAAVHVHAVCQYDLPGDLDGNCKVDLVDLGLMASSWLIDCEITPEDPACASLDTDEDGFDVFVDCDDKNNSVYPGAPEIGGDGIDQDCDGSDFEITWVSINDPGVVGHEAFVGQMSKYETTNAQYCYFLNEALASADIIVDGNDVIGNGGDYSGQVYYNLAGQGFIQDGATNGGAAGISWTGDSFTVDVGFEYYPVTYVSWYGAMAFADYYGFRLPTEWQWQAVADYDGSYTYGCGTIINNSIANYSGSIHPDGTTAIGVFGSYGYGMSDMAGNVWEWTSTADGGDRVFRGGGWVNSDSLCEVSQRYDNGPDYTSGSIGFRLCR